MTLAKRYALNNKDGKNRPHARADFFIDAGYSLRRVVALTGVRPEYIRKKKQMNHIALKRANYRRNTA